MTDEIFRVRARFSVLADYFTETSDGKAVLVGLFEQFATPRRDNGKLVLNSGWLITQLEADIVAGSAHQIEIRLINDEGRAVHQTKPQKIMMQLHGEGLGLVFRMVGKLGPIELDEPGFYEWETVVDGRGVTRCPMVVYEAPPPPR